jgi:hypothetical protein
MKNRTQDPSTNHPNRQGMSTRGRKVSALLFGCAALLGVATTAVAQVHLDNGGAPKSNATNTTNGAKPSKPSKIGETDENCKFRATLLHGREATNAAASGSLGAEQLLEHAAAKLSVNTEGTQVTVGASIDAKTYLLVKGRSDRRRELIDLVKDVIDKPTPFDANDDVDLSFSFGRNQCNLSSALDRNLTFKDFLNSDASLSFTDDDTKCTFTSLVEDAASNGEFDLKDFNLEDFDVDLRGNEQGFSIGLNTGNGTIGLNCNETK